MPSLEILATFALATLVFARVPGPAILYATGQTIASDRNARFSGDTILTGIDQSLAINQDQSRP